MTPENWQTEIDPDARKAAPAPTVSPVRPGPAPTLPAGADPSFDIPACTLAPSVISGSASSSDLEECAIGSAVVGRYVIEKKLGQGGMGAVYLCRDRRVMNKHVVVKVLLGELVGDEWVIRKFLQEIEALSRLDHTGIVGISDSGKLPGGEPFIVMEYIDGVTLHDAISPGGMDLKRAGDLIRQIGSALSAAHDEGIYHRDLKPENIMLKSRTGRAEQVRIIDFGIAKVHDSLVADNTVAGRFGTYIYMSPEQFRVEGITAASDIYSMGAIAYEMVTGCQPFDPKAFTNLGDMYSAGVKVPPRELRRELPERAQKLILKALSQLPLDRFQNAVEFGEALAQSLIDGRKVRVHPPSWKGLVKRLQVQASAPSPPQPSPLQPSPPQPSPPQESPLQATLRRPGSFPQASLPQTNLRQASLLRVGVPLVVVVVAALAVVGVASLVASVLLGGSKKPVNKPTFRPPVAVLPSTNNAIVTAPLHTLTYWLTVHKARPGQADNPFESSGDEVFEGGDRFELHVLAAKPGYLYVLNEGAADNGAMSFIILHPFKGDGSAKIDGGQPVQIGGRFAGQAGTEQVWIVWSAAPMADLEAARDSALKFRNKGRITDQAVVSKVREFLTSSASSASEVSKDITTHRTVIGGNSDLLLKRLELQHR
ncbi:MAG: protein kinase domain-containing protein [Pyrinomonadaceae bacterium]